MHSVAVNISPEQQTSKLRKNSLTKSTSQKTNGKENLAADSYELDYSTLPTMKDEERVDLSYRDSDYKNISQGNETELSQNHQGTERVCEFDYSTLPTMKDEERVDLSYRSDLSEFQ